jgi:hypothetical protein
MKPRISFEHSNILTVDDRIIQTDDTVPSALSAFVEEQKDEISDHMRFLEMEDRRLEPLLLPKRPVVLIARMAVLTNIADALNPAAVLSDLLIFDEYKYIQSPYSQYWVALSETGTFDPIAQRLFGNERIAGVWLGVTAKKEL